MCKYIFIIILISTVFFSGCIKPTEQINSNQLITKSVDELLPTKIDMESWIFSKRERLYYRSYPGFNSGSFLRIIQGNNTNSVILIKVSKWNSTNDSLNFYNTIIEKTKTSSDMASKLKEITDKGIVSRCSAFDILITSNIVCTNKNIAIELSTLKEQPDTLIDVVKIIESKR